MRYGWQKLWCKIARSNHAKNLKNAFSLVTGRRISVPRSRLKNASADALLPHMTLIDFVASLPNHQLVQTSHLAFAISLSFFIVQHQLSFRHTPCSLTMDNGEDLQIYIQCVKRQRIDQFFNLRDPFKTVQKCLVCRNKLMAVIRTNLCSKCIVVWCQFRF